ncbi:hypothetical protein KL930_005415, partial [Ogataea haglerorum]
MSTKSSLRNLAEHTVPLVDENHADVALQYARRLPAVDDATDAEYAALRRKTDLMILP